MAADTAIFFGLWLQKPLRIATANPSGPHSQPRAGRLSARAHIAVEQEPRFAAVLRRDFPGATVIEGNVARIGQYLAGHVERLSTVISSLPIKWLALEAQRAIVEPCLELLEPGGRFLQVTNAFSSPLPMDPLGICGRGVSRVWRNLLPVKIWSYSHRPCP